MILKGFLSTEICAIEAKEELDSGNIFLKRNLSLEGSANEIYVRIKLTSGQSLSALTIELATH